MDNRPVIFGEVLYDVFPGGQRVLGGAPFNVAWHLHAFGASPLMVTSVGRDDNGDTILNAMKAWGMDTSAVYIDPERPTGMVKVTIHDNEPSYDIVDNSAWDNITLPADLPHKSAILYHGTLALRHERSEKTAEQLRQSASLLFIDINLRPPWYNIDHVMAVIKHADWLKLNEKELQALVPGYSSMQDRVSWLHEQMRIENIIVTRGESGASLSRASGHNISVSPELSTQLVDTVGAGDAFSSIMILGIIRQWPVETTLERAQQFASAIVGQRGATVSDNNFYARIIDSWK